VTTPSEYRYDEHDGRSTRHVTERWQWLGGRLVERNSEHRVGCRCYACRAIRAEAEARLNEYEGRGIFKGLDSGEKFDYIT
jgi:hypothetical protein